MGKQPLPNPWLATRTRSGSEYDAPYEARAATGMDVHGEANLIEQLLHSDVYHAPSTTPYRVLDAGCGTGRLAIELARRFSLNKLTSRQGDAILSSKSMPLRKQIASTNFRF